MNLSDLQTQRRDWVDKNFPGDKSTIWTNLAGMVEELGELSHHILKRHQGIRGNYEHHTIEIRDAVADLIIFTCGIADAEGFDLGDVVRETWDRVQLRNWMSNNLDGQQELPEITGQDVTSPLPHHNQD